MGLTILLAGCGAIVGHPAEMRFSVVFIFLRFVLKERDCSLHLRPWESSPAPNETRQRVTAPFTRSISN